MALFDEVSVRPILLGTGNNGVSIGSVGTGATGICFNGQQNVLIKRAAVSIPGAAAATLTATSLIPAGSLVLGVLITVTSTFSNTSLTSMTIGDGSDADRWGATIALVAGTITTPAAFTGTQPAFFAAATNVVLTGTGASFAANGAATAEVFYISLVATT